MSRHGLGRADPDRAEQSARAAAGRAAITEPVTAGVRDVLITAWRGGQGRSRPGDEVCRGPASRPMRPAQRGEKKKTLACCARGERTRGGQGWSALRARKGLKYQGKRLGRARARSIDLV